MEIPLKAEALDKLAEAALEEDLGPGDLTTNALVPGDATGKASIRAKADGVVAGQFVAEAVYRKLGVEYEIVASDGSRVEPGMVVGRARGDRSRKLRQAMSLAVDAEEFKRIFINGRGVQAQTPIPPGIFGYDPEYRNPYRTPDLDRARELLDEAVNGFSRAGGVQRAENQVTGVGRFNGQGTGFQVAHLSDHYYVRILSQGPAKGGGK